jgi:PPM family protein phosphatase
MGHSGKHIRLRGSAITNVGKVRTHNEDNVHLWSSDSLLLAIVADGMGGAAAGEEASRIAVETISTKLGVDHPNTTADIDIPVELLRSAVEEANLSIIHEAVQHPSNRGMGTTVTMAFVKDNQAYFAHVGDSRAYRVSAEGNIQQITSDHSFVQALVEAKHITQEQAETHPMRNVLYRALGQTKDLDVDTYDAQLNVGDRLVLCSDGLTGHVRSPEIAQVASASDNPNIISQKLIEMANKRGGEDNISVITIIVDQVSDDQNTTRDDATIKDGKDTSLLNPNVRQPPVPPNLPPNDANNVSSRTGQDFTEQRLPHETREGHGRYPTPYTPQTIHVIEGQDLSYPTG